MFEVCNSHILIRRATFQRREMGASTRKESHIPNFFEIVKFLKLNRFRFGT